MNEAETRRKFSFRRERYFEAGAYEVLLDQVRLGFVVKVGDSWIARIGGVLIARTQSRQKAAEALCLLKAR